MYRNLIYECIDIGLGGWRWSYKVLLYCWICCVWWLPVASCIDVVCSLLVCLYCMLHVFLCWWTVCCYMSRCTSGFAVEYYGIVYLGRPFIIPSWEFVRGCSVGSFDLLTDVVRLQFVCFMHLSSWDWVLVCLYFSVYSVWLRDFLNNLC